MYKDFFLNYKYVLKKKAYQSVKKSTDFNKMSCYIYYSEGF
jgi:hypothetical protein